MTLRNLVLRIVAAMLGLAACTSPSVPSDPSTGCPERIDYPCRVSDVDPAILELEGEYMDALNNLLDTATYPQALEWIRGQDEVVAADANDTAMYFRLEGSQPVFIMTIPDDASGTIEALRSPAPRSTPALVHPQGVVGEGTRRENRQNRKQALFLEPFDFQHGDRLGKHAEALRKIPDYNHDPQDVWLLKNGDVVPEAFDNWHAYDAIFVATHGAQFDVGTWISTGIVAAYDPATEKSGAVCDEIDDGYENWPGMKCGIVEANGIDYVTVGLSWKFFHQTYPDGLDKAIVYMGGCSTLAGGNAATGNWDLAASLAKDSSAYFGWDANILAGDHRRSIDALLDRLIGQHMTAGTALDATCNAGQCTGSRGENLVLYKNGPEPEALRLYDLPTIKDPDDPDGDRLEDGSILEILGVPGDEVNDQLEVVIDFIGVIDPLDTGDPGTSLRSQQENPAELYNFRFFVDDQEVGRDNLGSPQHPRATVMQIDETSYRYAFTADLPFDVPEGGKDVTLKVEVAPLPEGGVSDYEVDVTLEAIPCSFDVTLSGGVPGWASGPAGFEFENGGIEVGLDGYLIENTLGDALLSGVFAPNWAGVPGDYPLTEATAARFDLSEGPNNAFYLAGDPDFDCSGCGGTLRVDRVDEDLVVGSFSVTLKTIGEVRTDPPPLTTVNASFQAVLHVPGDPFDPYSVCTDAWASR